MLCLLEPLMDRHTPLSCMQLSSTSTVRPVSFVSEATYVIAGLPCFLWPCLGSQRTNLETTSSLLLQCPANISLLLIFSEILGRFPYSFLLVNGSSRYSVQFSLSLFQLRSQMALRMTLSPGEVYTSCHYHRRPMTYPGQGGRENTRRGEPGPPASGT